MNRVFNVVNAIRSFSEDLPKVVVVKKILRSSPPMQNPKVSMLKDRDLSIVSLDELQSIMVAYEMCMEMSDSMKSNKEVSFQIIEKLKLSDENDDCDSDDERKEFLAYISKGLKKRKKKFKGTLPLICFRCGRIGHFAVRCKKKKKKDDSSYDDDKIRKKFFNDKNRKDSRLKKIERYRKKILMSEQTDDSSTEDFSSDDESSDEESVKFERELERTNL